VAGSVCRFGRLGAGEQELEVGPDRGLSWIPLDPCLLASVRPEEQGRNVAEVVAGGQPARAGVDANDEDAALVVPSQLVEGGPESETRLAVGRFEDDQRGMPGSEYPIQVHRRRV